MEKKLLDYNFPEALKKMTKRELGLLSYEIRDFLLEKVSRTGGHIASNLGIVELAVALHKVFDSPDDKIIWDVGHQSYVHKILTGRADRFDTLRRFNGLSGFPKRDESEHDMYDAGHASTSISIALGYATARDLAKDNYHIVPVIGDGALTGGIAFEALNNVGSSGSKMIIVLNDNEMSIDKNGGSLSQHLSKLRASKAYLDFKRQLKKTLKGIPRLGEGIYSGMEHIRDSVKYAIVPGAIFEELGLTYLGPINGHNIGDLIDTFNLAKSFESPVLVHVVTKKGKGYVNAETNPCKYHGIEPFDPITGMTFKPSENKTYSYIFGKKLIDLANENEKIVAISAAMLEGTGLDKFQKEFPNRTFDVGIAEQHAVTFAAGLALNGYRPVVAIYSTFLQRAYDQLMVDICLQKLPVLFMIDRGGNVGSDGETHHGIFDLSYLSHMPGMTVMAPKDGMELITMMDYAMKLDGPCAIRYPKGIARDLSGISKDYVINGCSEVLLSGKDVSLISLGKMVGIAVEVKEKLKTYNIDAEVINARFLKPADQTAILKSADKTGKVVTLEDNVITGGFGSSILSILSQNRRWNINTMCIGWPDRFIQHGSIQELFEAYQLNADSIVKKVGDFVEGKA